MTKEYSVKVTIKNNLLKKRMEAAGFDTIIAFCRASGVQTSIMQAALSFKLPLYKQDGNYSNSWVRISDFLNCDPEDLVPKQHWYGAVKKNSSEFEVDKEAFGALSYNPSPQFLIAQGNIQNAVRNAMGRLTAREQKVVKLLSIDGHILDDVAEMEGVTRERIRQIHLKALRKLKHPSRGLNRELLSDLNQ